MVAKWPGTSGVLDLNLNSYAGRAGIRRPSSRGRDSYKFKSAPTVCDRGREGHRPPLPPVGSRTGAPALGSGRLAQCFRTGPQFGCHRHVSSPLHVERSGRISRTALSCVFHVKGYVTYRAGAAFGAGLRTL